MLRVVACGETVCEMRVVLPKYNISQAERNAYIHTWYKSEKHILRTRFVSILIGVYFNPYQVPGILYYQVVCTAVFVTLFSYIYIYKENHERTLPKVCVVYAINQWCVRRIALAARPQVSHSG